MEKIRCLCQKIRDNILNFLNKYCSYLFFLSGSLLVRIVPFSLGGYDWDSIINEIAVGVFASVLVALLIAVHDDAIKQKDNRMIYQRFVLSYLSMVINYMSTIAQTCINSGAAKEGTQMEFLSWNKMYIDYMSQHGISTMEKRHLSIFVKSIQEKAQEINNIEAMLLMNHVASRRELDDIRYIALSFTNLEAAEEKSDCVYLKTLRSANELLNSALSGSLRYKGLSDTKYGFDFCLLQSIVKLYD